MSVVYCDQCRNGPCTEAWFEQNGCVLCPSPRTPEFIRHAHSPCSRRSFKKSDKAISPVIATIVMVAVTIMLAGVLVVYMNELGNPCSNRDKHIIQGKVVDKRANPSFNEYFITIHDTCSGKNGDYDVSQEQYNGISVGNTVKYDTSTGEIVDVSP